MMEGDPLTVSFYHSDARMILNGCFNKVLYGPEVCHGVFLTQNISISRRMDMLPGEANVVRIVFVFLLKRCLV